MHVEHVHTIFNIHVNVDSYSLSQLRKVNTYLASGYCENSQPKIIRMHNGIELTYTQFSASKAHCPTISEVVYNYVCKSTPTTFALYGPF